ncbi:RagB/SusD family nutrient uptake outer membrane protein [Solitalea koreensis]|uniref:SusD family protein n=1 Tax=Solitalea koreensis TaxID=543615 RepID=A0A521DKL8_9SPHI|nr:RagB/SusD family nutrient uptake outer membrane protein [Solitalea koreensis]SMO72274.1 SusD family protein [Solitalea koreensis]
MKNQMIKYTLVLAIILTGFSSCEKSFLELDPKGKLIAKNIGDYDLMLNNDAMTVNADGQILMGDETISIDPYYTSATAREQRLFRWDDVVYNPNEDAREMTDLIKQLYFYNKVITEVPDAVGGTEQQKNKLIGEAKLNRAWIYFMLTNYYGKPYAVSTAGQDLSFPIITAADVTATSFKRATVQEVYDFIISDLENAIQHLPVDAVGRTRGFKAAAEGLLGKVYVFIGRYADGLVQFNNALSHLPSNLSVRLYDYNVTMTTNGPWGYNPATTPLRSLSGPPIISEYEEVLMPKRLLSFYNSTNAFALLTKKAADLYTTSTDQRKKIFTTGPSGSLGPFAGGILRRNSGLNICIGLTMPDIYLLRAECKARTNDVAGAKADLETLRKNRMSASDATVNITDATAMVKYIIEERIREFALQGYRWFDMRRLSVDPIFAGTTYTHSYVKTNGEVTVFTLRPERFVMRFPEKVMNANPGMLNNP